MLTAPWTNWRLPARDRELIAAVTVYPDAPLLAGGVELADTAGTGSVFAGDTATARETLETMDAAVFVLTAGPPMSAGITVGLGSSYPWRGRPNRIRCRH
jgi:hypothetical protein